MKASEAEIERLCARLGVGTTEILDFLIEKRRAKIAMELDQLFETKSIEDLTVVVNIIDEMVRGSKTNGKKARTAHKV